jgi:lipid-A-disaccharide synthase
VSRPTALVARHQLRFNVPHISPGKLVLAERLVPELLQEAFHPDPIVAAVEPLLADSSPERRRMLEGYGRLRQALGEPGVTQRAASAILDQVQQAAP